MNTAQPDQVSTASQSSIRTQRDDAPIALEFSEKYDHDHAKQYFEKHQSTLSRRLSHKRDCQVARRALDMAGFPQTILDLPCGAGRFWPLLSELVAGQIYAADNSTDMLQIARTFQPPEITSRIETFQTSAFDIQLPDNSVDCVFCIRLLHHIADPAHRAAMLKEFHRITRDSVIISLWVDGNVKAWRRRKLEQKRAQLNKNANANRFIANRQQIEMEFNAAGFDILGHIDFIPKYAMWRTYVLRRHA